MLSATAIVLPTALIALCIVLPGIIVVRDIVSGLASTDGLASALETVALDAGRRSALLSSLASAAVIAIAATLLALPVAWVCRSWPAHRLPLLALPAALPTYLAYAALSRLRGPDTAIGAWAARADNPDLPQVLRLVTAVMGLTLWAWPLAAAITVLGFRAVHTTTTDALRLDGARPLRRIATAIVIARWPIVAALLAVFAVMLGSAVPLHVAQTKTYAAEVWLELDQNAASERWRAWLASWPLLAVAIVGSLAIAKPLAGVMQRATPDDSSLRSSPTRSWMPWLAAAAVWCVSIVLPAAGLATSIRSESVISAVASALPEFSRELVSSAVLAAVVGLVAGVLCLATWRAAASGVRGAWVARAWLVLLVFGALTPGVLVGDAIASTSSLAFRDSHAWTVLAHIARFGALAAAVGLWLAASEPRDLARMRAVDGATGPRGFLSSVTGAHLGAMLAVAVIVAMLSLHEIEAAVRLQPPGSRSLSRTMLGLLHFARDDDLARLTLAIVLGSGLLAAAVTVAASLGRSPNRSGNR